MIARDAVLAALRAQDVINRYQLAGQRIGNEYRTGVCPSCGPRNRKDAVAINLMSGRWVDHAHSCSGDLLGLVAGLAGLDARRDFARVLELAADIAGVVEGGDPAETARAIERRRHEEAQATARRLRERIDAMRTAAKTWRAGMQSRSVIGGDYLRINRGLDNAELERRDLVRYTQGGDPAVALWSSDGSVRNVVRRCIVGPTKVKGMVGCPTSGTLVGSLATLQAGQTVVITEGVMDTLTACLAWPDALVLGAHGASEMPTIALVVGRRARLGPFRLLIVAHTDPARADGAPGVGQQRAAQAAEVARAAGLAPEKVQLGGHKDLNEAWRAGWRP